MVYKCPLNNLNRCNQTDKFTLFFLFLCVHVCSLFTLVNFFLLELVGEPSGTVCAFNISYNLYGPQVCVGQLSYCTDMKKIQCFEDTILRHPHWHTVSVWLFILFINDLVVHQLSLVFIDTLCLIEAS